MSNVYFPDPSSDNRQFGPAESLSQWRPSFSAQALALSWGSANGLPDEIAELLSYRFSQTELLISIPDLRVALPRCVAPNQSDLFCLVQADDATLALTVEGRIDEPTGPTVGEWLAGGSPARVKQLAAIQEVLCISASLPPALNIEFLHCAAAAATKAQSFGTEHAALVFHSFSPSRSQLSDFRRFVAIWGVSIDSDELVEIPLRDGRSILLGWATGRVCDVAEHAIERQSRAIERGHVLRRSRQV